MVQVSVNTTYAVLTLCVRPFLIPYVRLVHCITKLCCLFYISKSCHFKCSCQHEAEMQTVRFASCPSHLGATDASAYHTFADRAPKRDRSRCWLSDYQCKASALTPKTVKKLVGQNLARKQAIGPRLGCLTSWILMYSIGKDFATLVRLSCCERCMHINHILARELPT